MRQQNQPSNGKSVDACLIDAAGMLFEKNIEQIHATTPAPGIRRSPRAGLYSALTIYLAKDSETFSKPSKTSMKER